ncbi:MAG: hypothetical protein LUD47_07520 [Clostridia bacterium]|nr:hypothetical protein [Clostridia bacterium]
MADYEISVIQGDAMEYWFEFGDDLNAEDVYLSCPFLNLSVYLGYSRGAGAYCFRLTTRQTERLKPCTCWFDVTAVKNGQQITLIHKGVFKVESKINKDYYFTITAKKGMEFRHAFNVIHKENIPDVEWIDFVCPLQDGFRKEMHFERGDVVLVIPSFELEKMNEAVCDYFLEVKYKNGKRPEICGSGFWAVER